MPAKVARLSSIGVLLFLTAVAVVLIWGLDGQANSESEAVTKSILLAVTAWIVFFFGPARHTDLRTRQVISVLLALKVAIGLLHFYVIFAPLAGITSASQMAVTRYVGDTPKIENAAFAFMFEREMSGTFFALWGDYYRAINNSGVGVIYGVLYCAFGPYVTTSLPWNAVAMGVGALVLVELGLVLGAEIKLARLSAIVMLLMPSFIVGPPLYRDQFMIMLILLVVFSFVTATKGDRLAWLVAIIATLALQTLREVYITIPFMVLVAWFAQRTLAQKVTIRDAALMFMGFAAILAVLIVLNSVTGVRSQIGETMMNRLSVAENRDAAAARVGGGYLGALIFMLFTPFPWYQKINPWDMAFQGFDYAQTFLFLSTLTALLLSPRDIFRNRPTAVALLTGMILLASAVVAPDLAQRYGQMGLPLLLLGVMPSLTRNWFRCGMAAAVLIAVAHIALEIVR